MTPAFDAAYREAFTAKLVQAMFDVSAQEIAGEQVHFFRAAELIDVMVTNIAILMRDSEAVATPGRTRQYCDDLARKLQRRIAEAKQTTVPFETVNQDRTN